MSISVPSKRPAALRRALFSLLTLVMLGAFAPAWAGTTFADLSITKTDGVTNATAGGSVTYTITATNNGPDATTFTVTDTLPGSLINATWTCTADITSGCGSPSGTGSISDGGNIGVPGGTVTYTLTATVAPSTVAGSSIVNTASVSGSASDSTPGNNSATDTDNVIQSADLSIIKDDGISTTPAGGPVTYTIVAANAGPSDVTGATVTDTLPVSLTGVTWTCTPSGTSTCTASGSGNISDAAVHLPAGSSVTYTVSATVDPTATGTLSNTATIASSVTDPTPGNNSSTDTDLITAAGTSSSNIFGGALNPLLLAMLGLFGLGRALQRTRRS